MPSTGAYLFIGAVAGNTTFLLTPVVGWLARRTGWLYQPNDRTVHTEPIPAFGGLAMYGGFLVAMTVARLMDRFDPLFARNSEPQGLVLALTVIVAAGLWDDIKGMSAPAKVTATAVEAFCAPCTESAASMKPTKSAPESPMKIEAGLKL